jgi:hypothetical protein
MWELKCGPTPIHLHNISVIFNAVKSFFFSEFLINAFGEKHSANTVAVGTVRSIYKSRDDLFEDRDPEMIAPLPGTCATPALGGFFSSRSVLVHFFFQFSSVYTP